MQALKKAFDASDAVLIGLSLVIGVLLAVAYARAEGLRSFLTVLSPAPIVFLCLFLFTAPVSKLLFAEEAEARNVGGVTRAPVVVVLFDEFPSTRLWTRSERVDAKRFPAFGAAGEGLHLVPPRLRDLRLHRARPAGDHGRQPALEGQAADLAGPPEQHLLAVRKTHRMNVSEEATSVCSSKLCKDAREEEPWTDRMTSLTDDLGLVWLHVVSPPGIEDDLASVSENWGNFGGGDGGSRLRRGPGRRGQPDGGHPRQPQRPAATSASTTGSRTSSRRLSPGAQLQAHAAAARAVGVPARRQAVPPHGQRPGAGLLEPVVQRPGPARLALPAPPAAGRLRRPRARRADRAPEEDRPVRQVADRDRGRPRRGVRASASATGARSRRENTHEIAPIPLFIKAPGQKKGKIDDSYVETIDILPTIFDILNLRPKVHMDGHSAFSSTVRNRRRAAGSSSATASRCSSSPAAQFEADKRRYWTRSCRLFGTGADGPERIYRIGPHQELLGKPADTPAPVGR